MKNWWSRWQIDRRTLLQAISIGSLSLLKPESSSATIKFQNDKNIPPHYLQNRDIPGFYIRSGIPFEGVDMNAWRLKVGGLVASPENFAYEDLFGFKRVEQMSRLKCVECWSAKALWEGFRFQEIIDRVKPDPKARYVYFQSVDTYYESYRIDELLRPRVMMVLRMDGQPLSADHGHPLRLIAPYKYGYKNIKYITSITFTEDRKRNYWADTGPYSVDGTIQPGIDHPLDYGKRPLPISGGEVFHFFDKRPESNFIPEKPADTPQNKKP